MNLHRGALIRVAPAVAVLVAAAAGCGGSSSRSTRATPPPTTATGAASGARPAQAPAGADWPTYHRTSYRTGLDPTSPALGRPRRAWSRAVDGQVYAEPLVAGGRVIVATEANSLYALDAGTGGVRWRARLGAPVGGSTLPCGNIDPSGITSTPVVDARAGVAYAAAFLRPAHHVLFALDLATGQVRWRRAIDPPGADPRVHQQRAALALSRGRVYVAYGGLFGDCGDYHGWVVSVPAAGPRGAMRSFRVPTAREGGIWAPSGPAVDGRGNVFVATGNGSSTSSFDFGNSVIRLSPGLRRTSFFAPREATSLNATDTDLGSTGPLLLPGGRVFVIGKSGVGYLLGAGRLGGIGGQLASRAVCGAAFGGSAYAAGLIYAPCVDGLVALRAGRRTLTRAWRGPGFRAGPPVVAGGAVWTVDLDGGTLFALDARTGWVRFRAGVGSPAQFTTPTAAEGTVYVGGGARVLAFRWA
jgi:outer membrane protein assembly factor BamB